MNSMNSVHKTLLRRTLLSVGCAVLGFFPTSHVTALGGVVYNLRFDQSEYVVPPGSTVKLKMYFDEVADTETDHRLVANSGRHLGAASVKITWSGGHSYVASVDDLTIGPNFEAFGETTIEPDNGTAELRQVDFFPPYTTWTQISSTPSSVRRVDIGTVSFTAADTPGDVTKVVLSDLDSGGSSDDFAVVGGGYYFSPDTESTLTSFTATIRTSGTAVPEPGGTALLTVLATIAVGVWRSQRRRRLANDGWPFFQDAR